MTVFLLYFFRDIQRYGCTVTTKNASFQRQKVLLPELSELVQTELKNRLQQVAETRMQHAALGGGKGCTNARDTSRACVHRCNLLLSPRTTASRTPGRFEIVKAAEHSSSSFFLPLCSPMRDAIPVHLQLDGSHYSSLLQDHCKTPSPSTLTRHMSPPMCPHLPVQVYAQ